MLNNLKLYIMRNFFYVLIAFIMCTTSFANETSKVEENIIIAYSTNETTIHTESKVVNYNEGKLIIHVGLDKDFNVSKISVSDNISKEDLILLKNKFASSNNCLTNCSRKNKCSDKGTSAGVIGCYAECAVDCINDTFKEKDDEITPTN